MFVSSCTCSLSSCALSREDAAIISKGLSVSASLTSIDLSGNDLGNDGAVAVAKALNVNASLESLK